MKTAEYQSMADLENHYWWFVGRKRIIDRQLERVLPRDRPLKILNIGCGTGGTVPVLEKYGEVVNADTSDEAIAFTRRLGYNVEKVATSGPLPFADESFDVVVAFDVLEHIEDDHASLKDWHRLLKPEGTIMLTVPAHQWLWSGHDESLHHFRRYSLSEIHRKLNLNQFKVIKRSYAIAFSFPMIVGYRFLASLSPWTRPRSASYVKLPRPVNTFFIKLLGLESRFLCHANFPVGTSVLAVARKS